MRYGSIAEIDKQVSRVAQGTMMLRSDDLDKCFALLDAVYATGVNTFDAGHVYGGGDCDRVFGQWVRQRKLRDKIVLMDKCCHHNADRKRVTPFDLTSDLHDCLARLGFDHIDIFAFHRDDPSQPVGPLIERLNEHVKEGKIAAFGASNWTHDRIAQANEYADSRSLMGFSVASPHYSLGRLIEPPWPDCVSITGDENHDARQWFRSTQMAMVTWSGLCGGFFSGRFRRDNLDSFTEGADLNCIRCYCTEDNFDRLDRAEQLAAEKNATVAQIALAYLICGPLNCFPLMAAWTPEQAAENAAAADIELTPDEISWLDLRSAAR